MEEFAGFIAVILLFSAIVTIVIYVAAICLAAALLYLLLKHVVVPVCGWLWQEAMAVADELYQWYREVTWPRRMERIQHETRLAIEEARREQIGRVLWADRMLARRQGQTADAMAAAPSSSGETLWVR